MRAKPPKFPPAYVRLLRKPSLLLSEEERTEFIGREFRRVTTASAAIHAERLFHLLNHYGLKPTDPGCWLRLSQHLAHDFVPGFKAGPKRRKQEHGRGWFAVVGLVDLLHEKREIGVDLGL
jgi:hypothetical protein